MASDTIFGTLEVNKYKQVQLLATLASLHTEPCHKWRGSAFDIVLHAEFYSLGMHVHCSCINLGRTVECGHHCACHCIAQCKDSRRFLRLCHLRGPP